MFEKKFFKMQAIENTKGKEIEIGEVYSNWKKAVMTNDIQFLRNFYPDDFSSVNGCGITKNKSEVLTRLAFKDIVYLCWTDNEVIFDVWEENAILKSRQSLDVELYGLPLKINREIILTFEQWNSKWILKNIKETNF